MGRLSLVVMVSTSAVAVACGPPGLVASSLVNAPEMPGDQAKCRIAASHENPLVTEWPASEKANLEARLREGSVVVSYSGCALKMLPRCRARGSYTWRRTTIATDTVEIRNADELYAKMPLGAVSLEGELQRTGRLAVQTTVSGQFTVSDFDAATIPKNPDCMGATHVVGALSVGAFKLRSGGSAKVSGQVGVSGFGSGGGSSSSDETVMREAGAAARCDQATEASPNAECASPIQIFLQPLPADVVDRGPAGTIKAKFLPVRPGQEWDVVVGDRKLCTTPCERWVDPAMPYTLKYDPGTFSRNELVELPDLRQYAAQERVEIRPTAPSMGELLSGIMATTFGGMAVVTGTVLTAAGCGRDKAMCTGGLITLPAGLALLVPGIWMIVDSKGTVRVSPMAPSAPLGDAARP